MKIKSIIFGIIFLSATFNLSSQELKKDKGFYKSTTLIYSVFNYYQSINDGGVTYNESASTIKAHTLSISKEINLLSKEYPNDEDLKEFILWYDIIIATNKMLEEDSEMWSLGYTLTLMNMQDFMKSKY